MMKKKIIYFVGITVLVICVIAYFKPLSFSDFADNDNQIKMLLQDFTIKNGEANIESDEYQDITETQKNDILNVLEQFTYRRNFKTLFSDGSMSGLGDKMLTIHVYENDLYVDSVMVSSSGKILINDKTYSMKNAEEFIEQIISIVQ